ncbi:HEL253Wp [Eremothecium sinecaudum]|uniref:HEL253Wp n=1 Tax=Eremothecium sinecaudum TaxID=45286 RepID=A0A109UZF5_9SACH|nr:HEL253Wp [Eremothecium sinecaudum]AMD21028.1 HEL253Wp [Eremothecium sinecaudum]
MVNEKSKIIPMKDQAAVVLEDGTIYKVQHKRQRKVLNCVPCHKRKVKCSRTRPVCDHCLRNSYDCVYFVNDRVSRGGHNRVPKESKQQLLQVIEKARQVVQQEVQAGSITSQGVEAKDIIRKASADILDNANLGNGNGTVSIDGSQPSACAIQQPIVDDELLGTVLNNPSQGLGSFPFTGIGNGEFYQLIPSKERCMALLEYYKSSVHPLLPLVNMDTYIPDSINFWGTWNGTLDHKSLDFLLLLLPMISAAVKAKFHEMYDAQLMEEVKTYNNSIRRLHALCDFPNKFSIRSLTGSVLLNSIVENPNITTVAQLTRLAQCFQLTSDPATYHGITDQELIQTRRILFWQIFQLDTLTALHNNLVPLIKSGEFDTALPTEVNSDGYLNPRICFLNAKYRFVVLMSELCQRNLNIDLASDNSAHAGINERILELHACCTGSAVALNSYLQRDKSGDPIMLKFIPWAIYMLNTFADRSLLLLHLFMIRKSLPTISKRKKIRVAKNDKCDPILDSGYGEESMGIQALLNEDNNAESSTQSSFVYNYDDSKNNLIPASLHYLDEFIKYQADDTYAVFNWELLIGHMPINAITFALKTLALDLHRAFKMNSYFQPQMDLRYVLISKAIPLVEAKIDIETAACKHCFQLIKLLFQLIQVKYGNPEKYSDRKYYFNKYEIPYALDHSEPPIVPQPRIEQWSTHKRSNGLKIPDYEKNTNSNAAPIKTDDGFSYIQPSVPQSILSVQYQQGTLPSPPTLEGPGRADPMFDDAFLFSANFLYSSDQQLGATSCAQIAPRTMKAIVDGVVGDLPDSWGDLLSSFNPDPPALTAADFNEAHEISRIYAEVQKYIILLSDTDCDVEYVSTGGGHYREFENALLGILCNILTDTACDHNGYI